MIAFRLRHLSRLIAKQRQLIHPFPIFQFTPPPCRIHNKKTGSPPKPFPPSIVLVCSSKYVPLRLSNCFMGTLRAYLTLGTTPWAVENSFSQRDVFPHRMNHCPCRPRRKILKILSPSVIISSQWHLHTNSTAGVLGCPSCC